MTDLWWYTLAGSNTRLRWEPGAALPPGADWTHVDFLNQFVYQAKRRHAMAYLAGYAYGKPPTLPNYLPGIRCTNTRWIREFGRTMCGADGNVGFYYVKANRIPGGGVIPAYGDAWALFRDNIYPEERYAPGKFVAEEFLTALKSHMEGIRIFGRQDVGEAGHENRRWVWQSEGAGPTPGNWEEEDSDVGGGGFGCFWRDTPVFRQAYREFWNASNPIVDFTNQVDVNVTAKLSLFYHGVSLVGTRPDGFYYPGTNVLVWLASKTALIPAGSMVQVGYIGILGHTARFNDYPITISSSNSGSWLCSFSRYAELVDVNLDLND